VIGGDNALGFRIDLDHAFDDETGLPGTSVTRVSEEVCSFRVTATFEGPSRASSSTS
jgi:hypothetical protein